MGNRKESKERPKVKFRSLYAHKKINFKWIGIITIITFFLSILMGYISVVLMDKGSIFFAILLLLLIIFIGVFFDLLGIATTAADETPFHGMASHRLRGAKESILIIRNASAVANFCNDVIGDICGIISGTASIAILVKLNEHITLNSSLMSMLLTALIAAITIGSKAFGKEIAMRHANLIVFNIGFIISFIHYKKK